MPATPRSAAVSRGESAAAITSAWNSSLSAICSGTVAARFSASAQSSRSRLSDGSLMRPAARSAACGSISARTS